MIARDLEDVLRRDVSSELLDKRLGILCSDLEYEQTADVPSTAASVCSLICARYWFASVRFNRDLRASLRMLEKLSVAIPCVVRNEVLA